MRMNAVDQLTLITLIAGMMAGREFQQPTLVHECEAQMPCAYLARLRLQVHCMSQNQSHTRTLICCTALLDLAALIAAHVQHAASLDNGMSETPALAWSTWNYFNGNVSDTLVREMADAMHDTGLFALGFRQINIDSGYLLQDRAADGSLQVWREFHQLYS